MRKLFIKLFRKIELLSIINKKLELIQIAIGRIEARQTINEKLSSDLKNIEFKVFSQWGEDGIIFNLINNIEIKNTIFVEFGVHDYTESNTRFLLQNSNWSGLVIDGSKKNIEYIKNDDIYWRHNLKAHCEFITKENINGILSTNGISGDIGLLSVDIDGNDYWVWEAITCIQPRIVVCEYNSVFGANAAVTTPYDSRFVRGTAHYSNLYYGASISALTLLANNKGYKLIGSNTAGNNLFFVREDLGQHLQALSPQQAFVSSKFREARNKDGELLNLTSEEAFNIIEKELVIDVKTDCKKSVYDAVKK